MGLRLPARNDGLNGTAADVLDGRQPESNASLHDGKVFWLSFTSGGRMGIPRSTTFGKIAHHLVRISHFAREERGHEFRGMMRFQVGRLERHQGISRRMGFIESVPGK